MHDIHLYSRIWTYNFCKDSKVSKRQLHAYFPCVQCQECNTRLNKLQHMSTIGKNATQTATRCNTLQHMYTMIRAPQTLQHSTTHCNACVQRQERHTHCDTCNTLQHMYTMAKALQTLQHTAIHFNTRIKRQERKTHCNTRIHEFHAVCYWFFSYSVSAVFVAVSMGEAEA